MLMSRANAVGTSVDVTWDVSQCNSSDYHLIYGDLSSVGSYTVSGSECDLGPGGSALGVDVPATDLWFLVIGSDDLQTEGSWGDSSLGARNGGNPSFECGIALIDETATCP